MHVVTKPVVVQSMVKYSQMVQDAREEGAVGH